MPKYSFIVPVYGCEQYLEECVESILAQKGEHDFEVILVDDGSKDRSGQIADELALRDSRVRTFHKENGGAASARNTGLREARGEYILFIDGDDTVEDQLLQAVDAALEQEPDALVIFGMAFDYYRENACIRSGILSCSHEGQYDVKCLLGEFKNFFYDNALSSACNKVFSAEIIRKNDLRMKEGMTLYEDYDFVLRYMACIEKAVCIAHPFYHYRNDLSVSHLNRRVESLGKLQDNMCQLFKSVQMMPPDCVQLREVTVSLYMMLLWNHLKTSRYTVSELENCTVQYCAEPDFRAMLTPEVKMGEFENRIFQQVENKTFRKLAWEIKKKQCAAMVKSGIKKLISAIGVKRY